MYTVLNPSEKNSDVVIGIRNVNCAELTKDKFIKIIKEDVLSAVKSYKDAVTDSLENQFNERRKDFWEKQTESIKNFANQKYKRASARDRYIENEMETLKNSWTMTTPFKQPDIDIFRIDGNCGTGEYGMSSGVDIKSHDLTDSRLTSIYDILCNTKYFKHAIGWSIQYNGSKCGDVWVCHMAKIKLILPVELQNEVNTIVKKYNSDIRRFYANSNYTGD